MGYGPKTGRGFGYCAGYPSPGFTRGVPRGGMGFGRGRGRGFGRGFRWRRFYGDPYYLPLPYYDDPYADPYYPTYAEPVPPEQRKEAEKTYLEQMAKNIEAELKAIRERLQQLNKESE
jgi:hypothetical protein